MNKVLILLCLILVAAMAKADDLSEAMAQYPVIIYVNKSIDAKWSQKIIVFKKGRQLLADRVSTGREQFEAERFSETPTGFYTPQYLSKDHVASKSGIEMPYSIFFNGNIALHQAVGKGISQLGRRASSGCVRLSPNLAPFIFNLVNELGTGDMPEIDVKGNVSRNSDGSLRRVQRYMALVIVDNSREEKPPLLEKIRRIH